jgi:hypothetical protein
MSDDNNEQGGGVGVLGGVASVGVGAAATSAAAIGTMKHRIGKHHEDVKKYLTKETIEKAETEAGEAFTKTHKDAAEYVKTVDAKATEIGAKGLEGEALVKKLKETPGLDAHYKASIAEHVKKDSKAEDVFKKGKEAHISHTVSEAEKPLIAKVEAQLADAAKDSKKVVSEAAKDGEKAISAGEKAFMASKGYAKAGVMGKPWAAFKGLGTGGKIATGLIGVVAAIGTGMAISNMRSGSHVDRLEAQNNGAQTAPAR